jgi:hypothetical protein
VGLVNAPWFWTPPLSPRDEPPGSDYTIRQSPDGKFQLVITGFDAAQLRTSSPKYFMWSELEWAEKERLRDTKYLEFKTELEKSYNMAQQFKVPAPLTLPGRAYVPHDFLYTNPSVQIYVRKPSS